jgi:hypothetical protein
VTIGMKIPFSDSSGIADGSTLYSWLLLLSEFARTL